MRVRELKNGIVYVHLLLVFLDEAKQVPRRAVCSSRACQRSTGVTHTGQPAQALEVWGLPCRVTQFSCRAYLGNTTGGALSGGSAFFGGERDRTTSGTLVWNHPCQGSSLLTCMDRIANTSTKHTNPQAGFHRLGGRGMSILAEEAFPTLWGCPESRVSTPGRGARSKEIHSREGG
jgi:hypothetical protein